MTLRQRFLHFLVSLGLSGVLGYTVDAVPLYTAIFLVLATATATVVTGCHALADYARIPSKPDECESCENLRCLLKVEREKTRFLSEALIEDEK